MQTKESRTSSEARSPSSAIQHHSEIKWCGARFHSLRNVQPCLRCVAMGTKLLNKAKKSFSCSYLSNRLKITPVFHCKTKVAISQTTSTKPFHATVQIQRPTGLLLFFFCLSCSYSTITSLRAPELAAPGSPSRF